MFIDAHLHVNFRNFSADDIIAYLDKNKIDKCWLLTWEEINPAIPKNYEHLSIEDIFTAYEQHPSRIVPMYGPDPNDENAVDKLLTWYRKGIRGCGELKVSLTWDSDKLNPLLSCVNDLGLPLIFHMENSMDYFVPVPDRFYNRLLSRLSAKACSLGISQKTIETIKTLCKPFVAERKKTIQHFPGYLTDFVSLEVRLKEYPKLNFVGHGPLFWAGISAEIGTCLHPQAPITKEGIICKLLSKYENLFADISGNSGYNALTRDPTFARDFLEKYKHKILYGTDNFSLGLRDFLDSLKLSNRTYQLIYGENANLLINQVKTP